MKKNKSYHAGWDHFTPEPGEEDKMYCGVCNSEMDVKRNVKGATGFAEAMSGKGHLHDAFSCPHAQKDWHNQARILKERINGESSDIIAKLLTEELDEVLKTKKPTRKRPWGYL